MNGPRPAHDDAAPVHFEAAPLGALSAKSHALQEALRENERLQIERDTARTWARAWKRLCKRINRESTLSQSRTLRLITKENPRSAEVAYTGLMLMAAFANDQGEDESVEECAFRIVAERDELRRQLNNARG